METVPDALHGRNGSGRADVARSGFVRPIVVRFFCDVFFAARFFAIPVRIPFGRELVYPRARGRSACGGLDSGDGGLSAVRESAHRRSSLNNPH